MGTSEKGKCSFSPEVTEEFLKKQYGIVGGHSAVQVCGWTKRIMREKGACYKQKFYGADCASCAQMSPAAAWCSQNCIFCWRPMEWMDFRQMEEKDVDSPEEIIHETVAAKRKLISGLGGADDIDERLFRRVLEAFPAHWAISLSGEPTLYPRLPELILLLKKNPEVKTVFLVTNGQEPEMLLRLKREEALPTQLYISVDAAEPETFGRVNVPVYSEGWERLNRTLEMVADFPCRRVLRFTVIKGVNDLEGMLPLYGKMFENSGADFIEVKAYMHLGYSRKRLDAENMPSHDYVKELCGKLLEFLPKYSFEDEDEKSRIVLLKNKDSKYKNIIKSVEG
ncbi:4-demethylwyosine synthase TYW1 [Candidatus Micrarchaeota archaeon]|nr:4-demethylwyosine synthase TYW1 [Candidatus Micrarchaeota archaeon]